MMKVAFLSPLPPAPTGIAHYSAMLLPALRARFDVTAFGSPDGYPRDDFEVAIYQLGNNPHHEWIYREAMQRPGVAVLHDIVLHHLIVEMTLARGDVEGYVAALEASHGAVGAAWARGRAAGLHSEMGNFLLPASIELANRSRSVIVHNQWARERLLSLGVSTPIVVVPHPYVEEQLSAADKDTRRRLGFGQSDRVIGFFGFVTSAKRAEVVLAAFAAARKQRSNLKLLIVGEPAPNIDINALAGEGITTTGYVDETEFAAYYAASDLLVNLRYPSAGETSGTLVRAFAAGKPVAVSNYAQFAEYPGNTVTKIDLGEQEVEQLTRFFLEAHDAEAIAAAQRRWLATNASLQSAVDGYAAALETTQESSPVPGERASIALFPRLSLVSAKVEQRVLHLTIRNDGDATIRTRTYGEPAYRVLVKLFDDEIEVENHWVELPCDLGPGAAVSLDVPVRAARARTLRLYDALESIPIVQPQPWASVEMTS